MLNEEYITLKFTFDFNLILDLECKRKNQIKIDLKNELQQLQHWILKQMNLASELEVT